ncbi:MAG: NADP-dependent oxidoreductase [Sphingobacterium sp.]|jgi:NADPH-dependent curcumin reductase CurA|nr:NADP-dependent oxidoreductase [Sphingobacterium sp.]
MTLSNHQIVLAKLPSEKLNAKDFRIQQTEVPVPSEGEVLVRTLYIAIDAASRAWMQGETYRAVLREEELMPGLALAEVVESHVSHLIPGDLIIADTGWQTYATLAAYHLTSLPRMAPLTHLLSIYGVSGLTAYFGLLRCGIPKEGETLVVSAAAGAVGSLVGQIGKILGCTVVGIAGGAAKCKSVIEEFGFDAVVDYKSGNLEDQLRESCPNGIDIYFDNVGGAILDAALTLMASYGRIVCCGAVSQYDKSKPGAGPADIPGLVILKSLTIRGFLLFDFLHEKVAAIQELETWVKAGRIVVREDIKIGLEKLPEALVGVLNGENTGKCVVNIGDV